MSDRLYLSCWLRGYSASNMLRHFEKMLALFPFSKLTPLTPVLRIYALEHAEPPLLERAFPPGSEPSLILSAARELSHEDCTVQVDAFWDLWDYDREWNLTPVAVTLACFGPEFDNDIGDHLRIEFGLDSRFLPQPEIEGSVRMVQSNIRSLLHLVGEIDQILDLERRQLWSESGANFAELVAAALENFHI